MPTAAIAKLSPTSSRRQALSRLNADDEDDDVDAEEPLDVLAKEADANWTRQYVDLHL